MFSSTSDQEDCTLHTRADPGLQTPAAVAPLEEKVPGRAVRPRQPSAHAPHPTQAGLLHPDAQVGVERYKEHVLSYAVVTTKVSWTSNHQLAPAFPPSMKVPQVREFIHFPHPFPSSISLSSDSGQRFWITRGLIGTAVLWFKFLSVGPSPIKGSNVYLSQIFFPSSAHTQVCDYHVALAGYFDVSAVKALNTAARSECRRVYLVFTEFRYFIQLIFCFFFFRRDPVMRKYQDSPESKSAEFRCLQLYIEAFENWNRQDLEAAFRVSVSLSRSLSVFRQVESHNLPCLPGSFVHGVWCNPPHPLQCFAEISRLDPEDLFALKRCQLLAFMRGDSRSLLGAALRVLPECQGKPFFHGMLSFALEQNGMLQLALAEGRRGVRIRESDGQP